MAAPTTPGSPASAAPIELQRTPDGAALGLVWQDGRRTVLAASLLRRACRCAPCLAARARGGPAPPVGNPTITAIAPIGRYAVNIAFSDGHDRGVYPWAYLQALAGGEPDAPDGD